MTFYKQLTDIRKATGWSQEELAYRLAVSFVTLNSWINQRSEPRRSARVRIEELYLQVLGAEQVDLAKLNAAKAAALSHGLVPKQITSNRLALDRLTLYQTYNTNTIEGSTMTLKDVQRVIFDGEVLANRSAIEQAEARNHQAAMHWLLDKIRAEGKAFVFDDKLILGLHLRLMNGIISDAGQYRRHTVRILGAHVPLVNWQRIADRIDQLVRLLNRPATDVIAWLAQSHASFEQIHPFSDGNGRTGRLIMLAQALHNELAPPLIAQEHKLAYYKYLQAAQISESFQPLEYFIAQSMLAGYNLIEDLL